MKRSHAWASTQPQWQPSDGDSDDLAERKRRKRCAFADGERVTNEMAEVWLLHSMMRVKGGEGQKAVGYGTIASDRSAWVDHRRRTSDARGNSWPSATQLAKDGGYTDCNPACYPPYHSWLSAQKKVTLRTKETTTQSLPFLRSDLVKSTLFLENARKLLTRGTYEYSTNLHTQLHINLAFHLWTRQDETAKIQLKDVRLGSKTAPTSTKSTTPPNRSSPLSTTFWRTGYRPSAS
ncbi:hypothetical protein BDY24DRAFT_107505 [Mrakia frigida]|uniref:uncharacterized protein n=1 Tax=Mrakia frigida TaxID=29902 RepID=UPI003FCC1957